MMNNQDSIHFRAAEETAHVFGVLLAVFCRNDDLVLFGGLDFGSVWMTFDEDFCGDQSFACDSDRSDVRVVCRVLQFALLLLSLRRSFRRSLVFDWRGSGQQLNLGAQSSYTHGLVAMPSLQYIEHASICDNRHSSIALSIRLGSAVLRQCIFFAMPVGHISNL